MIDRIVVENFKSLRRVDLKLGRMNLLIGANASGKSNFLDALRVLQGIGHGFTIGEILDGKPKSAASEVWDGIRGGSSKACYASADESGAVTIEAHGRFEDRASRTWEIEKGLHASRVQVLLELLRSQAETTKTQVVATTHSAAVLDWLQKEDYRTTFLFRRDETTGESRVRSLAEVPRFMDVVKKKPVSELFSEGWMEAAP